MRISDWSSDVCSSDLHVADGEAGAARDRALAHRQDAQQRLHRGALAAAVGADEGDDLARLDGDIDAAHQPAPAALHAKPPRLDEGSLARRQPRGRRSEEHTTELQSLMRTSYAVLCL